MDISVSRSCYAYVCLECFIENLAFKKVVGLDYISKSLSALFLHDSIIYLSGGATELLIVHPPTFFNVIETIDVIPENAPIQLGTSSFSEFQILKLEFGPFYPLEIIDLDCYHM